LIATQAADSNPHARRNLIQNTCNICACNFLSFVALLLTVLVVDLCAQQNFTPLHLTCFRNSVAIARLLLDSNANPNALDDDERSPLHRAALWDRDELVELFLEAGACPTLRDLDVCSGTYFVSSNLFLSVSLRVFLSLCVCVCGGLSMQNRKTKKKRNLSPARASGNLHRLRLSISPLLRYLNVHRFAIALPSLANLDHRSITPPAIA
jgi:ankyrin repeat protein